MVKKRRPITEADYGKITRDYIQSGHYIKYDRKNRNDYTAYRYEYKPGARQEMYGQRIISRPITPRIGRFGPRRPPNPFGPDQQEPLGYTETGEAYYHPRLSDRFYGPRNAERATPSSKLQNEPDVDVRQRPSDRPSSRHNEDTRNDYSPYRQSYSPYRYTQQYHRFKRSEKVSFPWNRHLIYRPDRIPPGVTPGRTRKERKRRERDDNDDKHNRQRRYSYSYGIFEIQTAKRRRYAAFRKKSKKGFRRYTRQKGFGPQKFYSRHY